MASQDAPSWLEIMKDRSSKQIEQPPLQSKISDSRIPNNPKLLTRQPSERSANTFSVYPARGLNRSRSAANVRRTSSDFARPPLPTQKDLPLHRPSKNSRPSNLVIDRQGSLRRNNDTFEANRDFSSRMATPRGRRTARPESIISSPVMQRANKKKVSSQPGRLSIKSPVELSSPLPISPSSRQGPADEMFSDSASLPSPNLELIQPISGNYAHAIPSLAPAPLNLSSTPKRRAASRPDSTTIPAFDEPSPNLQPPNQYSPTRPSLARNGSTQSKKSSEIPTSLTKSLLNFPNKLSLWKQSDFVRVAGSSKISFSEVSGYLIQERFYLHSLSRFLGLLLANVLLPKRPSGLLSSRGDGIKERAKRTAKQEETNLLASRITSLSRGEVGASTSSRLAGMKARVAAPTATTGPVPIQPMTVASDNRTELGNLPANVKADLGERLHRWLVERLVRLRIELDMIDEIAEDFPLVDKLREDEPNDATNGLARLFTKLGNAIEKKGRNVLTGLVLLFARERTHSDVWNKIKTSLLASKQEPNDSDMGVTREYLLLIWASNEAMQNVEELGKLIDLLWEDRYLVKVPMFVQRTEEGQRNGWREEIEGFELMWETVLDVQNRFWPDVS